MSRTKPTSAATRVLPAVDLLPAAEIDRRQRRRLARHWITGVLVAGLVTALAVGGSVLFRDTEQSALLAEQADTTKLLTQISEYSGITALLSQQAELESFEADLSQTSLSVSETLARALNEIPADMSITNVQLAVGGAPTGDDPTAEIGLSVVLGLTGPDATAGARLAQTLRGLEGVMYADVLAVTSADSVTYSYNVEFAFDQTIYTAQEDAQ